MMIIREKIGTLKDIDPVNRVIERLPLPWYESGKRILHKRTDKGREVVLKFMKENPNLSQDDVVYADDRLMIVIDIEPCEAIVLEPSSLYDMALVCYEIGNKHLPLFYDNGQLLIPFDATFFRWLEKSGYSPGKEIRKLLYGLKTSVQPHAHEGGSLFSKILHLTSPS